MTTYCKIENGIVVNRAHFDGEMPEGWAAPQDTWIASEVANIGWIESGGNLSAPLFVAPVKPPPTIDDYKTAIQSHIDAVARAKDYDSGVSLAGYKGSVVAQYASDAEAFTGWRDPLWPFVFDKLAQVQSGTIPQPTVAELIAMLPAPPWALPEADNEG